MTALALHDRLCKPHARYTTVRWCCRHMVTIGFPAVTYSLGLAELTETLCLIPILICFRLAEQLSKLYRRMDVQQGLVRTRCRTLQGSKDVFNYYLDSCMITLMYEREFVVYNIHSK